MRRYAIHFHDSVFKERPTHGRHAPRMEYDGRGIVRRHDFSIPRRETPGLCITLSLLSDGGRRDLRADAVAATASRPTSVTIASRRSCERDGRVYRGDLPDGLSGIFFESGLDT